MSKKNKLKYVLLIIFTLGLICIYWRFKYRQVEKKDYLTVEHTLAFSFDELMNLIGSKDNIDNVSATQKIIKIYFKERSKVNLTGIQKLPGISGISFQSKAISLVIGNSAKYLEELILKELDFNERS
ncbi:PTS system IIB component [Metamycoplasma arthritidis]|uniref:Glucose/sucrose specific PTS system IIB component n=1 Tax=Metamycoplasma arthritidis (strain 158L3-1) TaxID=243272 RepID=B3PN65_META1|nr:PTS glucose transporter subunit IIB [Metamycoplasma arthritidis]ACF07467.1 glucose/sucrose specific PTS system IIB component [Metamycoplasma arthritidis 158L3-1]VEU78988.1 PTS system IIB component [Metamycoplasma arthritidis]